MPMNNQCKLLHEILSSIMPTFMAEMVVIYEIRPYTLSFHVLQYLTSVVYHDE